MKFLALLFLTILLFASGAYAVNDTNLKGYWKFDETSGTTAIDSLGLNNGTLTDITVNQAGKIGKAYSFNGTSSKVVIANESNFDFLQNITNSISMCAWKWQSTVTVNYAPIIGKGVYADDIALNAFKNGADERYQISTNSPGASKVRDNTGINIDDSAWHFICGIRVTDTNMKLYVDGVDVGTYSTAGTLATVNNAYALTIGWDNQPSHYFAGLIDEVSVWNKPLTQQDITDLYASGTGITFPFSSVYSAFTYSFTPTTNKINLVDVSSIKSGLTKTAWEWKANNSVISIAQDYNYTATQLTDYNICLKVTVSDANTSTSCQAFNTGDWQAPVTTFSSFQVANTTDQNITLTCTDNNSGCKTINYKIDGNANWTTKINLLDRNYYFAGPFSQTGSNYVLVSTQIVPKVSSFRIFPTKVSNKLYSNSGYVGTAKYIFYFMDGTNETTSEESVSGTTPTYKEYSFTTKNKDLNYIELYIKTNNAAQYSYANDSNLHYDLNVKFTNYSFLFSGTGDHNIQFYSTDNSDNNETTKTSFFNTTTDTTYPTISYSLNNANGFSSDFNVPFTITCYDNRLDDINYSLYLNDTNLVYSVLDKNATTRSSAVTIPSANSTKFTFSCTDLGGNQTTVIAPTIYATTLRLINEATGAQLTQTDVNTNFAVLRAFTVDGNNSKDFNTIAGASTTTFIGTAQTIYFEMKYKDTGGTTIYRRVNVNYTDDYNVAVCAPFLQTFYQQRFISTSAKPFVLKNNVSRCYVVADAMSDVYDTGYALTTYSIAKPYYLYTWSNGAKTFLAFVDGQVATQYNIDAIELSRSQYNLAVGKDTVAFEPLLNPVTNAYDTNTLKIYYRSFQQDNSRIVFTIMNGASTLWTVSDTNSPNELLVNFLYTAYNISDENVLTLVVTTFNADDESVQTAYYFTINGASYLNKVDNSWAIVVAVLFFLFGITMVSVGRIFGFFGIIVCLVSIALSAYATNAWWVSLMQAGLFICLVYLILSGKQNSSGGDII